MNVAGNFTLDNNTSPNYTKGGTLTFDGTGSLTDSNSTLQDLGAVSITTNSTRTQATAAKMTSLSIASGSTYDLAGFAFTFSAAAAGGPTLEQLMRHGDWFNNSGVRQPFTF